MNAGNVHCPSCGAAATLDATKCRYCQAILKTVACKRCFGMMFLGSKFCPHCGGAAETVKRDPGAKLDCPRCHKTLTAAEVAGMSFDECLSCGGYWVSVESFDRICNDRELQAAATGLRLPAPVEIKQTVKYLPCPKCGERMNRVNYAGSSGVVIDVCKQHGIWLDRDELRNVVEFIRAGGVNRARQQQIQQLKEQRISLERDRAMSPPQYTGYTGPSSDTSVDGIEAIIELLFGLFKWWRK